MKAYKANVGSLPTFRGGLHLVGVVALVLLAAFLVGCDDGPTTSTEVVVPPPPPPPPPTSAVIDVEVLDFGGFASGQGNLFFVDFRMKESGGVGANINFIRLEVFRATGEPEETQEIGSGEIVSQTGSNRLEANQTREESVMFVFRATVKKGRRLTLTVGFTDDSGNVHNIENRWVIN